MRTITLHGRLGQEFGPSYRLSVVTPAEAVRALVLQLPGLYEALEGGTWRVTIGDAEIDDQELFHTFPGDYAIYPVLTGGGGGSGRGKAVGKIVLGVALTAAAFWVGGPGASVAVAHMATVGASLGVAIGLSGIAMLLAPAPAKEKATKERSGYLFDGPVNSDSEGGVVPLVYGGPVMSGGRIISGSIVSETTMGWTGPILGNPYLTTHTLTVGIGVGYNGFRVLKLGDLDPRNVSPSVFVREVSYGLSEQKVYLTIEVGNLSKTWLDHVRLSTDVANRFDLQGWAAGYATGAGYTQWYWDLPGNPMPKKGETLTLEIERTA
jgi:predicted phage tail protein